MQSSTAASSSQNGAFAAVLSSASVNGISNRRVVSPKSVSIAEPEPLLPRVAQGDASAVNECVARYGGLVHSLARRFLRNESDVEDACQDIFVALWKNAASFDASLSGEATFVALVSRRRLIDRLRGRREWLGEDGLPELSSEPDALERHLDARSAYESLESCSSEQRKVVLLSAHGYSHSEISETMSLPLGTVKSHYKRAIERVQLALSSKRGPS